MEREFILLGVVDAEIAVPAAHPAKGGVVCVLDIQSGYLVLRQSRTELGARRTELHGRLLSVPSMTPCGVYRECV